MGRALNDGSFDKLTKEYDIQLALIKAKWGIREEDMPEASESADDDIQAGFVPLYVDPEYLEKA